MDSFNTSKTGAAIKDAADVAEKLIRKSSMWSNVKVISQRPMIRLMAKHIEFGMECNISFGIQGTGAIVHTTRLIKSLFGLQDVCKQMIII